LSVIEKLEKLGSGDGSRVARLMRRQLDAVAS